MKNGRYYCSQCGKIIDRRKKHIHSLNDSQFWCSVECYEKHRKKILKNSHKLKS